ncbi:MAG: hypothetical protein JRI80_15900 [Deltaproteobacteria bacterium]|nr:hypothetical protein [Deltaproteobacteria bacterium]
MNCEKVSANPHFRLSLGRAFLTTFLLLLLAVPSFAADEIKMPCEVLEVAGTPQVLSDTFKKIHFMVIHHANAADRGRLSKWLKENSGTEVTFFVGQQIHKGVLYRLAHCFGRGLLIYTDTINVKARDIIEVTLTESLSQ